ncbi:uncharacterized protein LOC109412136 [Aedes albopictus]|uniref:CCHC-type domain-containing protein n=1 Tax=Aedes albopictus TaxID=7160 RepID=A0ABM1XU96_AEDAL
MDGYRINANDLLEEELDYELSIRSQPTNVPIVAKRRSLRKWLRGNEDPNFILKSRYELARDYVTIPYKLEEIEDQIINGRSAGCLSRLVHYHKRVRRYVVQTEKQKDQQRMLLYVITQLAVKYFAADFSEVMWMVPTCQIVPMSTQLPMASTTSQDQQSVAGPSGVQQTVEAPSGTVGSEPPGIVSDDREMESAPLSIAAPVNEQYEARATEEEGAVGGLSVTQPHNNPFIPPDNLPTYRRSDYVGQNAAVESNRRRSAPGFLSNPTVQSLKEQPRTSSSPIVTEGPAQPTLSASFLDKTFYTPPFQTNLAQLHVGRPIHPDHLSVSQPLPERESVRQAVQPRVEGATSSVPSNPERNDRNMSGYVHASQIENYVKAYLDRLIESGSQRMTPPDVDVSRLADRITNIEFRDTEAFQISRGDMRGLITPDQSPVAPLQLSSQNREERVPLSSDVGCRPAPTNNRPISPRDPYSMPRQGISHQPRGTFPNPYDSSVVPNAQGSSGYARRQPHQQCNIIEKWPKFSGDNNAIPVTDFLRQIDILCRSYDISKPELRMHAHLLFKENAYVWYTTYEDRFQNWETLESYLKMRYDNPNRDRIVKEELRNRKQRPNELFSAFLADIEMLVQRLNHKMTEREKYELIIENMKIGYKRRLALEPIQSIEHLAQMCYKFDALEPNLYAIGLPTKATVHQLTADDEEEDNYDSAEMDQIFALQKRFSKFKRANKDGLGDSKGSSSENGSQLVCWNCRQTGHLWKECNKRKEIFCHICGHGDTTAFRCPNQHNLKPREDEEPKNE